MINVTFNFLWIVVDKKPEESSIGEKCERRNY